MISKVSASWAKASWPIPNQKSAGYLAVDILGQKTELGGQLVVHHSDCYPEHAGDSAVYPQLLPLK